MLSYRTAQFDDKCGSKYLHLPVYISYREPSDWNSRWRYRLGMQGNLFPGELYRFSIVPPHLKTGCSFGICAFLAGCQRMEELGKLGTEIVRQTDSGPDNDAKETHAFHATLVHYGVVNRIVWVRLAAKHSHNFADRANSMLKEQIVPKRGDHQHGCLAPWDLADKLAKAMATQSGRTELTWHLANYDMKEWFKGCINKNFAGISSARYFIYEYDPTLPDHGFVRVTYRENLLDEPAESNEPEFKPAIELPNGSLVTNPKGHVFMDRFPSLNEKPPMEPFVFAEDKHVTEGKEKAKRSKKESWGKEKVFKDIRLHLAKSDCFTDAQRSQWEVLDALHDEYDTADKMPSLPFTKTAADGSTWEFAAGSPFNWAATWQKLAWRCDRPHDPRKTVPVPGRDPALIADIEPPAHGAVVPAPRRAEPSRAEPSRAEPSRAGSSAPSSSSARQPRNAADMNVLTGRDYSKSARKSDLRDNARGVAVEGFPDHLDEPVKDQIVLVKLSPNVVEGKLMVGLGKVKMVTASKKIEIAWFARSQWACPEAKRRWEWATTPFFKALPHTFDTTEDLSDILPIIPTLTPSSAPARPRLECECVRTLERLCLHRGLVHSDATKAEHMLHENSGSDSGDSSDSSDNGDSSDAENAALVPAPRQQRTSRTRSGAA